MIAPDQPLHRHPQRGGDRWSDRTHSSKSSSTRHSKSAPLAMRRSVRESNARRDQRLHGVDDPYGAPTRARADHRHGSRNRRRERARPSSRSAQAGLRPLNGQRLRSVLAVIVISPSSSAARCSVESGGHRGRNERTLPWNAGAEREIPDRGAKWPVRPRRMCDLSRTVREGRVLLPRQSACHREQHRHANVNSHTYENLAVAPAFTTFKAQMLIELPAGNECAGHGRGHFDDAVHIDGNAVGLAAGSDDPERLSDLMPKINSVRTNSLIGMSAATWSNRLTTTRSLPHVRRTLRAACSSSSIKKRGAVGEPRPWGAVSGSPPGCRAHIWMPSRNAGVKALVAQVRITS